MLLPISGMPARSPLVRHARQGRRIERPRLCEPPTDEVVSDLLAASRQAEGPPEQ